MVTGFTQVQEPLVFFRKASHGICSMASTPSFHSAGNCRRGYPECQAVAWSKIEAISTCEVTPRPTQPRAKMPKPTPTGHRPQQVQQFLLARVSISLHLLSTASQ